MIQFELMLNDLRKELAKEKSLKNKIVLERIIQDLNTYQRAKEDELLALQLAKQAEKKTNSG